MGTDHPGHVPVPRQRLQQTFRHRPFFADPLGGGASNFGTQQAAWPGCQKAAGRPGDQRGKTLGRGKPEVELR